MTEGLEVPTGGRRGGPAPVARPIFERLSFEHLRWGLAAIIFAGSFWLSFLTVKFHNDHFDRISRGRQILVYGEAPFRDFFDPGYFLTLYSSAAVEAIFGDNLLGEAFLTVSSMSVGFALTFLLSARASRSIVIASLVTILVILMNPRLNNYDKVLFFALGLFLSWNYIDRRTSGSLCSLAVCTGIAFLFRYDIGLYLGIASVVMLLAIHRNAGGQLVRRLALYAAFAALPTVPFLVFLQANGGVVEYFRQIAGYAGREGERSGLFRPPVFVIDFSAPLVLVEAPSTPPAVIRVRWSQGVTDDLRGVLEQRYGLANPRLDRAHPRQRTWTYTPLDASTMNLAALVQDPHVEVTGNIDAKTYRLKEVPPEPPFVSWQRAAPLLRITGILPGIFHRGNINPWLYYLVMALLPIALLALVLKNAGSRPAVEQMPFEMPKMLTAVALCAAATPFLVRDPIHDRVSEVAGPVAVIGVWLLGHCVRPWRSSPRPALIRQFALVPGSGNLLRFPSTGLPPALRVLAAVIVLSITGMSIVTAAEVGRRLEDSRILAGPTAMLARGAQVFKELGTSPPIEGWAPPGSTGLRGLIRYVHECTRPSDRLLVTWFAPELYFHSGRGFAGGQVVFFGGHWSTQADQRTTLTRLQAQTVPIILVRSDVYDRFASGYNLIDDYLLTHYDVAAESSFGDSRGPVYRVLVDRRPSPTGTYERWSLPCFT